MNLVFGEHTIILERWEDERRLRAYLDGCREGHILLEGDPEPGDRFDSATLCYNGQQDRGFGIGICSHRHGLSPVLWLVPESGLLLFGFDSSVVGWTVADRKIAFALDLESVFFQFVPIEDRAFFLVHHEIGVLAIKPDGEILWRFSKDIVTNLKLDGQSVSLWFLDAAPVRLRLEDGEPVRKF